MLLPRPHVHFSLLALALGSPLFAAGQVEERAATEQAARTRVAVLIVVTGDLDPAIADGLTELLIGAVAARGNMTIVGKEEFQAQLGQGDAGTLECISSMPCMGRVGVQLDVSEVIAGTLAQREERWVFNLNRVNVRSGEVLGRVFREIEGDLGVVADALAAAIPQLYEPAMPDPPPDPPEPLDPPPPDPGTLVLTTRVVGAEVFVDRMLVGHITAEGLRHEAPAGALAVRVTASGYHPWSRTVRLRAGRELHIVVGLEEHYDEAVNPWFWIGGGLAIAGIAVAIPIGVSSKDTLDFTESQLATGEVTRAEVVAFYDARRDEALAANLLFGLTGALAISAAATLFFPWRSRVDGVALVPAPGGLGVGGAF